MPSHGVKALSLFRLTWAADRRELALGGERRGRAWALPARALAREA